ncbi:MAG: PilZ domain-containing protein [Coxiellaceae bacterium]|nr:PilZ domain-containing protein [Coxiellaceae bacterium]
MHQLHYVITDKKQLYQCYMPFVQQGGLFIPTGDHLELGQSIDLGLELLGAQYQLVAKVIWKTPHAVVGRMRPAGVGLQFAMDQEKMHNEIENQLAGYNPTDVERFTF